MNLHHISKSFGSNVAVEDVSLDLAPGEIAGLIGENGAGKTTLMRIVAGELAPDQGTITGIESSAIGFVHQHFMLVPEFTIAENLALTAVQRPLLITTSDLEREAVRMIGESGIALTGVQRRAGDLSVGEKAKLELIKAIARRPRLLILDEPTSVLAPTEASELFEVVRAVASRGATVVFISHKLPEVLEVATRILVMREGHIVAQCGARDMTASQLAAAMVGPDRRLEDALPATRKSIVTAGQGADALSFEHVTGETVHDVTFRAAQGEVVAIIGVAGNGQSELAAIARGLKKPLHGAISIRGTASHIPEDRTGHGLVAEMSIAENLALTERRWHRREAAQRAARLTIRFNIKARSPQQLAGSLSGGNQQKVILARALDREPDVVVAAEPTRGLDLDATRFVHEELRSAAARGAAILLITSDLDEAFALADAIHVIYRGRLSDRLTPAQAVTRAPLLMAGLV